MPLYTVVGLIHHVTFTGSTRVVIFHAIQNYAANNAYSGRGSDGG